MTLYGWGEDGLAADEETGFFMSVISESLLRSLKRLLLSPLSSYCRPPPTSLAASQKLTPLLLHHFSTILLL